MTWVNKALRIENSSITFTKPFACIIDMFPKMTNHKAQHNGKCITCIISYHNLENQKIHQRGDYKSIAMIMGGEGHMAIKKLSEQIERFDQDTSTNSKSKG